LAVKEVSLNQALCGFTWNVKHLDGRVLIIKTKPGEVIKPDMNPFVRGNLYVMFRVKFSEDSELYPLILLLN
jgi:DnaJ family protein A protein 2